MSLVLLLDELTARRIGLCVEEGKLHNKAMEGALTSELRDRIGAQKEALFAKLNGHGYGLTENATFTSGSTGQPKPARR